MLKVHIIYPEYKNVRPKSIYVIILSLRTVPPIFPALPYVSISIIENDNLVSSIFLRASIVFSCILKS